MQGVHLDRVEFVAEFLLPGQAHAQALSQERRRGAIEEAVEVGELDDAAIVIVARGRR